MDRSKNRIRGLRESFLSGMAVPEPKPFVPDAFQLEAIDSLRRGQDTLVVAPTGSGKTFIAMEGIREVCRQGKRACYTAPLKALSNSKYTEFKQRFEPEYTVGLLTGDRKIDGDANIVISTTEIYRNELYSYTESYGLVVLDELHYLADPQRGPVWEESIILSPQSSALLMLSASVSNGAELCEWIESIRKKPVHIITMTHRPVELRLGFLHPDYGVLPLEDENGRVLDEIQRYYSGQADFRPGVKRRQRGFRRR